MTEPVIGVLTYPSHGAAAGCADGATRLCSSARTAVRASPRGSYVDSSYLYWLEAAGARVVPIRYDLSMDAVRTLYSKVNGVLFTGGPAKPLAAPSPYFETATLLYDLVVRDAASTSADAVPLWGTCLGLQTISCIANGGRDVLGDYPLDNFAYPLTFTPAARTSKLFGSLTESGRSDFAANVTTNWHSYGVAPKALVATDLVPLATDVALNGRTFVSALEGKGTLPVFAVQFHPESVQWQSASDGVPAKSAAAVRSVQHLSRVLVERARNNSHAFASEAELAGALMQRQGKFTPTSPDVTSLYPGDGVYTFD